MANSVDELKALANTKLGFARANRFLVTLPTSFGGGGGLLQGIIGLLTGGGGGASGRELNILCSSVTLPGKITLTNDRRIGMEFQKVAYGYAVDDVSMTFYLMNDYGVKEYFELWQNKIINNGSYAPAYKNTYARDMQIVQLRKGIGFDTDLQLGPFTLDIDLFKSANVVYECTLINAYPKTMTEINLSNDGALVELTMSFAYDNWKSARFYNNTSTRNLRALGTLINTVNNIIN